MRVSIEKYSVSWSFNEFKRTQSNALEPLCPDPSSRPIHSQAACNYMQRLQFSFSQQESSCTRNSAAQEQCYMKHLIWLGARYYIGTLPVLASSDFKFVRLKNQNRLYHQSSDIPARQLHEFPPKKSYECSVCDHIVTTGTRCLFLSLHHHRLEADNIVIIPQIPFPPSLDMLFCPPFISSQCYLDWYSILDFRLFASTAVFQPS